MTRIALTVDLLCMEAKAFSDLESRHAEPALFGVTDGKAVGTVFVEPQRTADFQMTRGLRRILENEGNEEDLMAFMSEKNLPVDEIELKNLAEEILRNKPEQGYLTISNALQWRLQYGRVIENAGSESGLRSVYKSPPPAL